MTTTPAPINILILSIYRELAEDFQAAAEAALKTPPGIESLPLHFDILAGDPGQDPAFEEHLARASTIFIVARFLDVLSLEKIKNLYRCLPDQAAPAVAVFILRDPGEVDFKISCPSCGQKLWLRDTDVGKRGRCPNCTKPFVILAQADHLRTQLILPEKVKVFTVTRQQPDTFHTAFRNLFGASGLTPADPNANLEALKNVTVRIQIQDP